MGRHVLGTAGWGLRSWGALQRERREEEVGGREAGGTQGARIVVREQEGLVALRFALRLRGGIALLTESNPWEQKVWGSH